MCTLACMRSVKLKESKLNDEKLLSKCCWYVPGSGETTLQRGEVGGDLVLAPCARQMRSRMFELHKRKGFFSTVDTISREEKYILK